MLKEIISSLAFLILAATFLFFLAEGERQSRELEGQCIEIMRLADEVQ